MNTSTIVILILAIGLMLWRRTRAMRRPVRGKGWQFFVPSLILLVLGSQIFINPQGGGLVLPGSWLETIAAVLLGILFAIPLIFTTNYEVREDGLIYPKQSKGFLVALVGLIVVRLVLREYLSSMDPLTQGRLFFLLAFTYLTIWRVVSYFKFRRVLLERNARI